MAISRTGLATSDKRARVQVREEQQLLSFSDPVNFYFTASS
jgi:hypothetical protein